MGQVEESDDAESRRSVDLCGDEKSKFICEVAFEGEVETG